MHRFLDDYRKIQNNLKSHDRRYPSADELYSLIHVGNISSCGDMEEETEEGNNNGRD